MSKERETREGQKEREKVRERERVRERGPKAYFELQVVETWFYLWRITKKEKYREWAWEVVLALEKYSKVIDVLIIWEVS